MDDDTVLLVTLGDPNGVGPELACDYFTHDATGGRILLLGPEAALEHHRSRMGLSKFWRKVSDPLQDLPPEQGVYLAEPRELQGFQLQAGQADPGGGLAAGLSLSLACDLIREGLSGALVTLPLNKAMLQEAGFDFPGHTEFLAQRAGLGPDEVCMHLCGDVLRVSLVTTHPPLHQVPELITREKVVRCLKLTADFVSRAFGRAEAAKAIAVCGLNPHAGEQGRIGREEIDVIAPAMEEAARSGVLSVGPLPADTLFFRAAQGEFSAVLAMYHDQGLGPLKLLHFTKSVNVTLGLPFVRTSVDHGTAYELVGKGEADTGSFREAIRLAKILSGC